MIDHYQQSIFDGTEQSIYNQSIELIKTFEEVALQRNPVGYVVGYSGGKDSDVLVDLFRKYRVGCIGCPIAGLHRVFEFERYPKYKARFIKLCDDIMELRKRENLSNKYGFKNGTEYFNYWLYEELPKGESLFDMEVQR